MATMFDTATVKDRDRFASWQEVICRLHSRTESPPARTTNFNARLSQHVLGGVRVSDITCDALRYDRTPDCLRTVPSDHFFISLLLDGEAHLSQGGRVADQRSGDIVVYDTARPFTYDFPQRYRLVLLSVPRRALLTRVENIERLTSRVIRRESALGGLAAGMMTRAATLDLRPDSAVGARVSRSIIDMISATLEIELDSREDGRRQASLITRAKDVMRAHLDDPELDIGVIADAMGVSPRTLSRVFASEGTTVMRWLWRERIEAAHRALLEGRSRRIIEIALDCGFSSASHFSRVFRNTYGTAPQGLLRDRKDGAPE